MGPPKAASSKIDRRDFVKTAGQVIIASGFAGPLAACASGVTSPSAGTSTGTVTARVVGFRHDATTAGSVSIPVAGSTISIALPAPSGGSSSGSADVPVGTYQAKYSQPAQYKVVGSKGKTVQIKNGQTTQLTWNVTSSTGTLQVAVSGYAAGDTDPGTVSAVLDTGGNPISITLSAPAGGTASGSISLPLGSYQVTYTPSSADQLQAGETPTQSVTIGTGGTAQLTWNVTPKTTAVSTGVLQVTVGGYAASDTNPGTVSAVPSVGGNPTPITLSTPSGNTASGSASLPIGSYNVTYTPSSTDQLTSGEAATQSVTIATGQTAPLDWTVTQLVAGSTGGVLFHSDWSTATGKGTAALYDTNKSIPWNASIIGNRNADNEIEVITDPTGSAPTTNVLSCNLSQGSSTSLYAGSVHADNVWPTVAQGNTIYRRLYVYLHLASGCPSQSYNSFHPVGDDPTGSGGGDPAIAVMLYFGPNSNGTWRPAIGFYNAAAYSDTWWAGPNNTLNQDEWYRYEWATYLNDVTNSIVTVQARIYDSSGTLVATGADFHSVNGDTSRTLDGSQSVTLSLSNKTGYRSGFSHVGNNGPSGWSTFNYPGCVVYWAAVAAGTGGWLGPYSGGI